MINYTQVLIPFILTSTALLLYYVFKTITKPYNYPPGPRWLPLFGCSNAVKNLSMKYVFQHLSLQAMSKKYSTNILGLKLGGTPVVVVFGEDAVKRVFLGEEFEGRPDNFFMKLRCMGRRIGITAADGPVWYEHRQFTSRHLKNVGYGKHVMEQHIQLELQDLIASIEKTKNNVHLGSLLAPSVMNVLWIFAAGKKISKNDDRLQKLLDLMSLRSKAFGLAGGVLNDLPWVRFFAPDKTGYSLICKLNQELKEFIMEAIEEHKQHKVGSEDFIYSFLDEVRSGNDKNYTDEHLIVICLDLFVAGSQTTSNTLDFAFLSMLRNQNIQNKVHKEIDEKLGGRWPCIADRNSLPYTYAVLLEVQRMYTVAPLAGPRRVLRNTTVEGYDIPKDTTILISCHSVHTDPGIWKDPEVFRPERFIDAAGNLQMTEHLYHFGLGRRRCLGEALAKGFTFIFFAGILQKYRIVACNGTLPTDIPVPGITLSPQKYLASLISKS